MKFVPGCGCCGPPSCGASPASLTVTVNTCGIARSGVTVTATLSGATTQTGTTNGSGQVVLSLPNSGTWTVTVTAPSSRFNGSTNSIAVTCGGSFTLTSNLSIASGYVCCGCHDPIATTLYGTDSNGTWTFTWTGTAWNTCYTATDSSTGVNLSCGAATVTYSRQYTIFCSSGGRFRLDAYASSIPCAPGFTYYNTIGRCSSGVSQVSNGIGGWNTSPQVGFDVQTGCLPLSLSFNIPNDGSTAFTIGTITVTE